MFRREILKWREARSFTSSVELLLERVSRGSSLSLDSIASKSEAMSDRPRLGTEIYESGLQ